MSETTGRLHRLGCDGDLKGSDRPGIHGHDLYGNCLIDQSTADDADLTPEPVTVKEA